MIDFGVLGPVVVRRNGTPLPIGAAMLRKVLALLLCRVGQPLTPADMADALWDGEPPPTARKTLQVYVYRLRRILADDTALRHGPAGYWVEAGPSELDSLRFAGLVEQAREERRAGDLERAGETLRAALGLWRGEAYADAGWCSMLTAEANRLAEQRLLAEEERIAVDLDLGRHAELAGELALLTAAHPYREQLRVLQMLALHRAGRRADALAVFRETWTMLADQLGIEPDPRLRRLHAAILRADERLSRLPVDALDRLDEAAAAAPPTPLPQRDRVVPQQLPADVAGFVGRAGALARLDELVAAGGRRPAPVRAAVIVGSAGVGKTALAVHWAQRARNRFPDGQLYVDLHGYDTVPPLRAIDALARFLQGMGVPPGQVPVNVDEAAAMYRSRLAGRRMLILLDNANSAAQVRPLLPGDPACLVLITSREELAGLVARDGAHRVMLDVLLPQEADALLGQLLGRRWTLAGPEARAELGRICANLPLALRIAAAHLVRRANLDVETFVAELAAGDRLAALEVDGDEQAAVGAAFDLSYRALAPEARRMFRLVGLVPSRDVTPESAAALSQMPPDQAARLLRALTSAHLLSEHQPGRFGAHDLLRLYATRRAEHEDSPQQRAAALGQWYDYYQSSVDQAARLLYPFVVRLPAAERDSTVQPADIRDDAQAAAWLDAERATLVAAITHASVHGSRQQAWLLADSLRGYLQLRMEVVDWLTVAQAGLGAAEADDDPLARAAAGISLATLHLRLGDGTAATVHFEQALELARRTGWVEGEAAALGNLGAVHFVSGRLDLAADHYQQAAALNRQAGAVAGEAVNRINLGGVFWSIGALEKAVDQFTEALSLYRKGGARSGMAASLTALAQACHSVGRLDEAASHLSEAIALQQALGDRAGEAEAKRLVAEVHRDTGQLASALDHAEAALTMARDLAFTRLEAATLATTGTIHHRLRRPADAIGCHRRALELARAVEATYTEAVALLGVAAAEDDLGDRQAASDYARQALSVSRRVGYRALEAQARRLLSAVTSG